MAGMHQTPKGGRVHIGIFGRRNAGKSSLINRLTKQNIALVSEIAGTTTDPVYKAMEILPIGPIMIIDTAGIDDVGDLGKLRIGKTREVMSKTDVAVIVLDANEELSEFEEVLLEDFDELNTEVIIAVNKIDVKAVSGEKLEEIAGKTGKKVVALSSQTGEGFDELRACLIECAPRAFEDSPFLRDLIKRGDTVLFCVPIDTAAPKGRLILPQVLGIRDVLDAGAAVVVAKEDEVEHQLAKLKTPPALAVTDSQVFEAADRMVGRHIPLTSFSILMARQKGDLNGLVAGANAVDTLKPGDKVLIAEACTHLCQADDIGRVKIPKWLQKAVGGQLNFEWYTGDSFPENVSDYKLVIHCGACMINRRAMLWRQKICKDAGVPMVNYGVLIAKLHGVLERALSPVGIKK